MFGVNHGRDIDDSQGGRSNKQLWFLLVVWGHSNIFGVGYVRPWNSLDSLLCVYQTHSFYGVCDNPVSDLKLKKTLVECMFIPFNK